MWKWGLPWGHSDRHWGGGSHWFVYSTAWHRELHMRPPGLHSAHRYTFTRDDPTDVGGWKRQRSGGAPAQHCSEHQMHSAMLLDGGSCNLTAVTAAWAENLQHSETGYSYGHVWFRVLLCQQHSRQCTLTQGVIFRQVCVNPAVGLRVPNGPSQLGTFCQSHWAAPMWIKIPLQCGWRTQQPLKDHTQSTPTWKPTQRCSDP